MTVPEGVNSRVVLPFVSTSPVSATTSSVISATYNGVTRTATITVTALHHRSRAARSTRSA